MSFRFSLAFALAFLATPAAAQSVEDARAAYFAGDYEQALEIARTLSNEGDAGARNIMGVLFENGLAVIRDPDRAILYYEVAIAQGNDRAMANLGTLYSEGAPGIDRQPGLAQPLLERAIALGNVGAINSLGLLFELGGFELNGAISGPDLTLAIQQYREAMALGDMNAAANLGGLYLDGRGVVQDDERARAFFSIAADGGLARGMERLATMLEFGLGGSADMAQALALYERAAEAGNLPALYALGDIYTGGVGGVEADITRGLAFYERGHAAGDADSSYALGWTYEGGHGVPADPERALGYYQAAYKGGSPEATQVLGMLYQDGVLLPVDLVYSRFLLEQAVEMNEPLAYNELGIMMVHGRGGPVDWPRADGLFRAGYRQGDAATAINLARLLNDPDHQRYDPVEAYAFCLWGLREAPYEAPDTYAQACADIAGGLSPADQDAARTRAASL